MRIGLVEFILILFIASVTVGPQVALFVDRWLRRANRASALAARRKALAYVTKEDVVHKLFTEIAPKYTDRNGGYTRVVRTGPRRGDAAEMAVIELL